MRYYSDPRTLSVAIAHLVLVGRLVQGLVDGKQYPVNVPAE
jgi:hypothetical protein